MKALIAALLLTMVASSPGYGQSTASPPTLRQACAADVKQTCPDAKPGRDRRQCLRQNVDKLSDGCKAALAARRRRPAPPASQ